MVRHHQLGARAVSLLIFLGALCLAGLVLYYCLVNQSRDPGDEATGLLAVLLKRQSRFFDVLGVLVVALPAIAVRACLREDGSLTRFGWVTALLVLATFAFAFFASMSLEPFADSPESEEVAEPRAPPVNSSARFSLTYLAVCSGSSSTGRRTQRPNDSGDVVRLPPRSDGLALRDAVASCRGRGTYLSIRLADLPDDRFEPQRLRGTRRRLPDPCRRVGRRDRRLEARAHPRRAGADHAVRRLAQSSPRQRRRDTARVPVSPRKPEPGAPAATVSPRRRVGSGCEDPLEYEHHFEGSLEGGGAARLSAGSLLRCQAAAQAESGTPARRRRAFMLHSAFRSCATWASRRGMS